MGRSLFALSWLIATFVPVISIAQNLSGTYAINFTTICQEVEGKNSGTLSQTIGLITFAPSSSRALSGTITARFTQSLGAMFAQSPNMNLTTDPTLQSGTFSLTLGTGADAPSTIAVTLTDQLTFTVFLSDMQSRVYRHADFIGLSALPSLAPTCTTSGSLDFSTAIKPS